MKILIVEDEKSSSIVLDKILKPWGRIDFASDAEQAVSYFMQSWNNNDPYDVLFLDILLPDQDGHWVLKKIRNQEEQWDLTETQKLKVIMVTALEDPQNVVQAFYQGQADSYIIKPVDKEKISREMREIGLI